MMGRMVRYDFRSPRLYVEAPLDEGALVPLVPAQRHYLTHVLRLTAGSRILAFNGRDGEWEAAVEPHRRAGALRIRVKTREQTQPTDLHYLFAPLQAVQLDHMVQKAVEMGASRLQPVLTRNSRVLRVNVSRMQANAIEAAEQCGILTLPQIDAAEPLSRVVAGREPDRYLVFCDEGADVGDPCAALAAVPRGSPLAVLVGPQAGFADDERAALIELPNVIRLALGPRILRADTAAVAALALVQAAIGDWRTDAEEG